MEKEIFDNLSEEIHDKLVNILIELDDRFGTNIYAYSKLEDAITEVDIALGVAYKQLYGGDENTEDD